MVRHELAGGPLRNHENASAARQRGCVDDEERTDRLIRGIVGKRLTYRETVNVAKAPA